MANSTIVSFINKVSQVIINPAIQILFLLALLYFLWGVFNFVKGSDADDTRETGKRHMIWGIFGMFIMISAYGILNFIIGSVGVDGQTQGEINQVLKR
jgi:hypothetical protein